jgi:hypothetical protein
VIWVDLDPFVFNLNRDRQSCMAFRLFCSFWEALAGSGSIAKTAVSSANVAVVISEEDGRSEV